MPSTDQRRQSLCQAPVPASCILLDHEPQLRRQLPRHLVGCVGTGIVEAEHRIADTPNEGLGSGGLG
ncbi:hypothetical protein [Kineosporia sp. NBRC 101731]|uniref:hypothetical protein n=1 Tax=Kineosporia sp. NBRC 101731 TaxID=3032199 RepID=UPI00255445BA|nr:hypothetical protein [Kineosporia sp. NBRC 101731]